MKSFEELSEKEVLALAISLEEEDERVYADFAEGLRENFPASAAVCEGMRKEESGHRRRLIGLYQEKFGEHIPLIRRQDVRGFVQRKPVWLMRPLGLDTVRKQASAIELETRGFYEKASQRTQDASIRQLLDDLANEERSHEERADALEKEKLTAGVKAEEEEANRRLFVLQIVQPGLAGLMDGSVSTLAPVFAAARILEQASMIRRVPGRARCLRGGGDQHGFRRGALRRRQPHRARASVDPRTGLRRHDRAGRHRPHAAVPDSRFPLRHGPGDRRSAGRTGSDHLDPPPVHGHANPLSRIASRLGRGAGVCDGNYDWQQLVVSRQ